MKKRVKKALAFILAFAMVISVCPLGTEKRIAKAATDNKITAGDAAKDTGTGVITFPNLTVEGSKDNIKSISIQFSSAVEDTDEINMTIPADMSTTVELLTSPTNVTGYDKHIILNAADDSTTVTNTQWQKLLRDNLSVVLADNNIRKLTFMVDTEVSTRFVEYNYFNGHYYEVVSQNAVSWKEAYAGSETKTYRGMPGYLVTITSKEENDFVVSICNVSTWIGSASDPDYTGGKGYRDKIAGKASFYFTGGDEKGELMCTAKMGGVLTEIGSIMKEHYTNWAENEPNFRDDTTKPNGEGEEKYVNLYIESLWGAKPKTWNDFYNSGADMINSYVVEYGNIVNNGYTISERSEVVLNSSYSLDAHDFILTTEEAKELNDEKIKGYGGVSAKKDNTEDVTDEVIVKENTILPKEGLYTVAYEVGGEVTKSIYVKVVDTKSENTADSGLAIYANGFTLTTEEVNNSPNYKELSGVIAKEISTNERLNDSDISITANTVVNVPGEYSITFTAMKNGKTESVTVPVTVVEPDKVTITASDFVIAKDHYLNADMAKEEADVLAIKGTTPLLPSEITADISKATYNPGDVFDVTFSAEGVSTTIKVTVMDEATSNHLSKITIGANDFTMSIDELGKGGQTLDTMKLLSNVIAKNYDGTVRKDIAVDISQVQNREGTYPVTFTTGTGSQATSVTVNVTITASSGGQNQSSITADDFVIGAGEVIDKENAIELGNARGTDQNGNPLTNDQIIVNNAQLEEINQASKGKYPLTFATPDGKTDTIIVTVKEHKEDNSGDGNTKDKISIAANDFIIGTEDYDLLTKENVIKLSNGVAINETKNIPVEITTVDTSKVENKPGTYDVTLSTADGTSVTIQVTISADHTTIGDVDKAAESNEETGKTTVDNDSAKPITPGGNPEETPGGNPGVNPNQPADTVGPDVLFEKTSPKDIPITIDTGRKVTTVTVDGKPVPPVSYTISDDKLIVKKAYSGTLPLGKHSVVMQYADGSKKTFNMMVVEYNAATIVRKVPIYNMSKKVGVKSKFTLNLVGITKTAKVSFKTSNKKIATVNQKGVITGKKKGKCTISGYVIQNGAYYRVKVKIIVVKKLKNFNLTKRALSKKSGVLPEFNVYKRVFKGKKAKLKFTSVEKDSKISYRSSKKKIATVSKKGVIRGKKKGFCVITASIRQNGKTFITRVFVRVDDHTKDKRLKKYLK